MLARDECQAKAVKAQFRAQKLKDRINLMPPRKSTNSEIITVEKMNGREIETKHVLQMEIQAQIEDFYRYPYAHRECQDSLESIKEFLGEPELPQVTKHENKSLDKPITAG